LAARSFGVSGRSRSASRRRDIVFRIEMDCAAVGWAVSTGEISASLKKVDGIGLTPASFCLHSAKLGCLAAVRAGQQVGAAAADVVLVFRDVGQVREVGNAHHGNRLFR
jgi:hypothetical protein